MDGKSARAHPRVMAEIKIRNIPERVRKGLRLWALIEEKSLNTLVIELLTKALDKHEGNK